MSMATLLERLSRTTREKKQNAQDRFLQLVRKAAKGEEFDIEEAADILEAANRTHEQLEDAVEIQQDRIGLAAQLKHKQALDRELPQLESVERQAGEHYAKVVSEASERLNAAKKAKRDVEHELLQLTQIEVRLRETCLDSSLLARETELNMQRTKLIQQRRPLEEDLSRSAGMIQSHEFTIKALEKKSTDKLINPVGRASYKKELDENSRALAHERNIHTQLTRAIADIHSELGPIDQSLAAIRLKKLEV